jgi:hypothetical protein
MIKNKIKNILLSIDTPQHKKDCEKLNAYMWVSIYTWSNVCNRMSIEANFFHWTRYIGKCHSCVEESSSCNDTSNLYANSKCKNVIQKIKNTTMIKLAI